MTSAAETPSTAAVGTTLSVLLNSAATIAIDPTTSLATSPTKSTTPTSTTETSPTSTSTQTAITTQISFGTGSGSVVSWSPLTTTFIPPSSCFNRYYQVNSSSSVSVITSGTLDPTFNECQLNGTPDLTYSPGMCPGRMTTAVRTSSDGHFTELCCQR